MPVLTHRERKMAAATARGPGECRAEQGPAEALPALRLRHAEVVDVGFLFDGVIFT